jgi:pimeloyl-ACP methyl ester carboxylesterase
VNEHFLTVNGLRLRVLDWGNCELPTIFLLHGFSSTAQVWTNVAEALGDRYHLVALDQRGHGSSEWDPQGRYGIDDFAADAREVSQRLGLAPFVLIGHSMGGSIAYTYAATHPEDVVRLIIEDAAPRPPNDPRPLIQPMPEAPVFASRDHVVTSIRAAQPSMPHEALERRVDVYYVERADGTWRFRADVARVRTAISQRPKYDWLWEHVRNIQCPALVIRAGQEPAAITREIIDLLHAINPRIEVVTVPDAGHNVHFAHFEAFMPVLEGFLMEPGAIS